MNRIWKIEHRFRLAVVVALLILSAGVKQSVYAQDEAYLYRVNPYNFIRYDLNQMHFPAERTDIERFYKKMEKLMTTGEGRINIVHIGGSHIQAGTFSGQMRHRFQLADGAMNAGWGYMFPYRIARTNSPFGYYVRYTGAWQSFRNVERRKSGTLGIGGISASTNSPMAELTILLENENAIDYRFNKLRIYYENKEHNYEVSVDSTLLKGQTRTSAYIDFVLKERVDSLKITLAKSSDQPGTFTLFGINAESGTNGVLYHSIGINGAYVPAFLRCQLFGEQLADLQPDLVILGLGINDAYGRRFSQSRFEDNYEQLVTEIKNAAPNAAIIFTTNNDSYLYRRYVNRNGEKVRESMHEMAKKYDAGVWDMYEVMGGLNSIVLWQRNGLARSDKIHFTREGYLLLADLFFTAVMQDFEGYLKTYHKISLLQIPANDEFLKPADE